MSIQWRIREEANQGWKLTPRSRDAERLLSGSRHVIGYDLDQAQSGSVREETRSTRVGWLGS